MTTRQAILELFKMALVGQITCRTHDADGVVDILRKLLEHDDELLVAIARLETEKNKWEFAAKSSDPVSFVEWSERRKRFEQKEQETKQALDVLYEKPALTFGEIYAKQTENEDTSESSPRGTDETSDARVHRQEAIDG